MMVLSMEMRCFFLLEFDQTCRFINIIKIKWLKFWYDELWYKWKVKSDSGFAQIFFPFLVYFYGEIDLIYDTINEQYSFIHNWVLDLL